ncbi:hypothetical protein ACLVWU_02905 [Bdellovibrio sp. HCB290]|uniref:hypothetical protein n=1 Tax=Bdellovibrio sp. HCB290 TaxID=3394356 RepID=UPI0039B3B75C
MNSRWLNIVFAVLTFATVLPQQAFATTGTRTPQTEGCELSRNSKLAMDQRDNWRMNCMKRKKSELTVTQCLTMAKTMEYSNNAEDARMICLYDLKKKITLKDCANIAKQMEYADSGDEAKWHCLREFSTTISKKQCNVLAKAMAYPPNTDRAEYFCENELK